LRPNEFLLPLGNKGSTGLFCFREFRVDQFLCSLLSLIPRTRLSNSALLALRFEVGFCFRLRSGFLDRVLFLKLRGDCKPLLALLRRNLPSDLFELVGRDFLLARGADFLVKGKMRGNCRERRWLPECEAIL